MTSQLISCLLVLIGLTICLSNGIYGEDIENKEVLSTPVENTLNKLAEDAEISNIVKREALPDATAEKRKSKRGDKKESPKKRKWKNRQRNKNDARKNRQGNKNRKRKNRQGNKNRKRKNRQESKKGKRKNRRGKKKHSLKSRRRRNRQGKKKDARKNSQGNKKERISKQTRSCTSAAEAIKTAATAIKTNKKYLNHMRLIRRTFNWQNRIIIRSNQLPQYNTTKELLENVTWSDGTYCPGDPSKNAELIDVLANLTKCASSKPGGSIVEFCNLTRIPNRDTLNTSVERCLVNSGPAYNSYTTWIAGFDNCTRVADPTCGCYEVMNANNNVYDVAPYSCKSPNVNGTDWILSFQLATKKVFNECNKATRRCKGLEKTAFELTSICCAKHSNGTAVTNQGRRRRMQIKASMLKKIQKMNVF